MKQKIKYIAVIALAVCLILSIFVVGLTVRRNSAREFEQYVLTEGPWGSADIWASSDGKSYLVCQRGKPYSTVMAYFKNGDSWQEYELSCRERVVYLNVVQDGAKAEENQARMKFDGTTFTIYDLDNALFGEKEYRYGISDRTRKPN